MVARAFFDEIRELSYTGISASYASVGTPTTVLARGVCFTNNTDGDMYFTDDVTKNKIFVAANSFKLWDIQSNMNASRDDRFVLPEQTQFSVKRITVPTTGSVYIELIY